MTYRLWFLTVLLATLILAGCTTITSQISGRTSTEQYLVTAAVERAIDRVSWQKLRGRKVMLEIIGVQDTEYDFIRTVLKSRLGLEGIIETEEVTEADLLLTTQVYSVGTDIWIGNFGIPLTLANNPEVPSYIGGISIYNSNLQKGYCRLEFFISDPRSKQLLWQIEPVSGKSYFKTTSFLGVFGPFQSSDIFPEELYIRPENYIPIPKKDKGSQTK